MAVKLSVNLNKIALLRNSRLHNNPDVTEFTRIALENGANGITLHPRPDGRHIRPQDVTDIQYLLKKSYPHAELNIEGNPFSGVFGQPGKTMCDFVLAVRPHQFTAVPDADGQLTSDHGWQITDKNYDALTEMREKMRLAGIRLSMFADPKESDISAISAVGAERVELYTESYAKAYLTPQRKEVLSHYHTVARHAVRLGMGVNAGHDLDLQNLPDIARLPGLEEVSIGHALTADALRYGFAEAYLIALTAILMIMLYLVLRYGSGLTATVYGFQIYDLPLLAVLLGLIKKALKRNFGSDFLAGISIVTALIMGEYLAGSVVVLMMSGGEALEHMALKNASSVLTALAKRMPSVAHLKNGESITDVSIDKTEPGQEIVIYPHEICPADGTVTEGYGTMDEAYLTGEPYLTEKAPGATVFSGSVNGNSVITVCITKKSSDSRYAQIMQVMRESEQRRPKMRRIADTLGAYYTPLSLLIAVTAWILTGDPIRFLSVLMVATPCPLIIAIPTAIIGTVSLSAKRGIIIKDPTVLEKISTCRTAVFDKTGTLTYGEPELTEIVPADGISHELLIRQAVSMERDYDHARKNNILPEPVASIHEKPGEGLWGDFNGEHWLITGRRLVKELFPEAAALLPAETGGLECVLLRDRQYAGLMRFRDKPRNESRLFIDHLSPSHRFDKIIMLSGDRENEVRYLAEKVGITEIYAGKTPEEKLEIVRELNKRSPVLYVGDGINDAPALTAATVGLAFGKGSDITGQAAGAVIMDTSLTKVDELIHIGMRMRAIALQSALGGIILSILGMLLAAAGLFNPLTSAIVMEVIDVMSVLNAFRASFRPKTLSDF
ncbi:hypothetical protein CHS0354_026793 [Potamilus streckersoni]|uniref:P-type ATPase A domain-containing protein n=1 Tax=Potamilus streckersoni TaxID=2493646 RepID=A0AAE0T573_9BIVA|nr:hypothetical protein CHS0354_026793 [Potamilus streckersoni]